MSNDQRVRVDVDERKIGNAAGKAAGNQISRELSDLKSQIRETTRAVEQLSNDVERVERRISEVERTKAQAERQAIEELKETLQDQVEQKREEYERRIGEILDDYRGSVKRLKDRFLNSITDHEEQFGAVEGEFTRVTDTRDDVVDRVDDLGASTTSVYGDRAEAVTRANDAFRESVDAFLEDREETAATIDSLRTSVAGIDGPATVTVPFWIVGLEKDGTEEIRALPVLERMDPKGDLSRASPFREGLRPHPTHGYTDMIDAVHSYVVRDDVRDTLARRDDGAFADPSLLERRGVASERFVDTLREYELDGDGSDGSTAADAEREAEVTADA